MAKITKVFGPPGTGKTTFLLDTVEKELARGVQSTDIGYFSFTRKAATEARDRAIQKFPLLNEKTDFPYFRTLHSLAFRQLNISAKDMMMAEHYAEFSKKVGIQIAVSGEDEDHFVRPDNPILNEINLARITGTDLRTHYNRSDLRIEWFHLEYVERAYRQYKEQNLLLDFTDLLERLVEEPFRLPNLETVIIDEAQDLSRLQWKLVEHLVKRCKKVYIAGDDDQCQPGESIVLTNSGAVRMDELDEQTHRLICYDRNSGAAVGSRSGYKFKKASRSYSGDMYTVRTASGLSSAYTDNHWCVARWKSFEEIREKRVVYLMQRGDNFRVGQCQVFRSDGCVHAWVRAFGEKADRMWFLRVEDSLSESTFYENLYSYLYGIPQTIFQSAGKMTLSQEKVDQLFSCLPTKSSAIRLLHDLGISYDYPVYTKEDISQRRGGSQIFKIRAAALCPELMRVGAKEGDKLRWESFSVEKKQVHTLVYSLDVEKHHNYFSDGILTNNCIFTWAGADVNSFLGFEGDVVILDRSYRIPSSVHILANDVVERIQNRQPKVWAPREYEGTVQYYNTFYDVDVTEGNWLILAGTNYMLNNIHPWLKEQGLLFERNGQRSISDSMTTAVLAWEHLRRGDKVKAEHVRLVYKLLGSEFIARGFKTLPGLDIDGLYDMHTLKAEHGLLTDEIWHKALTKISEDKREYLIAMLRRGTKITAHPRIKVSTIHGAKGGEADNVLLLTDLGSRFSKDYHGVNSDAVNRMFYVGITRAKESLHLVRPVSNHQGFHL